MINTHFKINNDDLKIAYSSNSFIWAHFHWLRIIVRKSVRKAFNTFIMDIRI